MTTSVTAPKTHTLGNQSLEGEGLQNKDEYSSRIMAIKLQLFAHIADLGYFKQSKLANSNPFPSDSFFRSLTISDLTLLDFTNYLSFLLRV